LRDAVVISQDDADLRRRHAFLRHLRDHVFDFIGGGFAPERRRSFERDGRFGHPFSFAVHATHVCKLVFCCFFGKEERERRLVFCFLLSFLLQKTFAQHTVPKRSFLFRTKIARPSSRRRCAQNTTTPGNDHNIRKGYVHNDTKTVASARSYLRISSNKTHSYSSRSKFLSRLSKKRRVFSAQTQEKKNEKSQREQRRRRAKRERRFQPLPRAFNSTCSRSRENERI
jgi:hypothetical protein